MSESQQGPEICDVISRKRYLFWLITDSFIIISEKVGNLKFLGKPQSGKVRFTQSQFGILCAVHNLNKRKKKRKKLTLGSHFTLSRGPWAYKSCLACQPFISNQCVCTLSWHLICSNYLLFSATLFSICSNFQGS